MSTKQLHLMIGSNSLQLNTIRVFDTLRKESSQLLDSLLSVH